MTGSPIRSFMPLHLDAFTRWPPLKRWVEAICTNIRPLRFLEPTDWFDSAHSFSNCVWAPPPAAADVVVEQLSLARHKRSTCLHLVVVPRLFTGHWRKHLSRATDFYFKLENDELWPLAEMHEPVLIFVCLPLITHSPNFEARGELLDQLEWLLLGPRVQEAHEAWHRDRLSQLLSQARQLSPL